MGIAHQLVLERFIEKPGYQEALQKVEQEVANGTLSSFSGAAKMLAFLLGEKE